MVPALPLGGHFYDTGLEPLKGGLRAESIEGCLPAVGRVPSSCVPGSWFVIVVGTQAECRAVQG